MSQCEDYPCCGHTDGLGCDWTSPNDDPNLWYCNMEHGSEGEGAWHKEGTPCPYWEEENEDDDE